MTITLKNPVHVVNMNAVTPLASTSNAMWDRLSDGQSSIKPHSRFDTRSYISHLGSFFENYLYEKENTPSNELMLNRLIDKLLENIPPLPEDTLLFYASNKGGNEALERHAKELNSDPHLVRPQNQMMRIQEACHLTQSALHFDAACAASTVALSRASAMIATGMADSILVFSAEVVTDFMYSIFSGLGAMSPESAKPFDKNRDGLSMGDGGAFLLLMSESKLKTTSFHSHGRITGWGISNDAFHVTAPHRESKGLIQAIEAALLMSEKTPKDIAAILAHGTGTIYNDQMEMQAFRQIFSQPIPVNSIKGSLGHTMAATGALQAITGFLSLKKQSLPPTVGLENVDSLAEGWASNKSLPINSKCLMTTNSGFGGINCSLILERP